MVWWQRSKRAVVRGASAAGLAACLGGCNPPSATPTSAGLPEEVGIEILNPDRPRALRCNPDIRLDRKVTVRTLEALSQRLLETEAADCDFGLATYYLPVMRPGSGAWAIAELGPEISVSMLGLSAEGEQKLIDRATRRGSSFGLWVDDTSYASVMTLSRDNIGLQLTRFHLDGGADTEPIHIATGSNGLELRPMTAGGGRHYRARSASTSISPPSRARTTRRGRSGRGRRRWAAHDDARRRRRSAGGSSASGWQSTRMGSRRRGLRCAR